MCTKVEPVTLGLATIESLPEIQISHFIACKNYEEKITTIHMSRIYNGGTERNQQQYQKNNGIKRILLVDDEYDISLDLWQVDYCCSSICYGQSVFN
jgi:hypothetical protein